VSQFITQGDIVRDQFDWGEAGWVSRPELTGSRGMCVMDVTLQPGAGHPFHRHPDQEEIIWVREGRIEQWLEDQSRSSGPARPSTSRRTSSTAPTRSATRRPSSP
jgi:oxalate decarboxylase/phosphoglucose isomerase-like protein (cupin superfamily)